MRAMLTSRVFHNCLLNLLVLELTFPVRSTQHSKTCYALGNRNVCFFRPEPYFTWVTHQQAWGICRSKNGTLPIIPDQGIQGVFEEYMISLRLTDLEDMWLAGREVRRRDWTWVNAEPFNQPPYFDQTHNETNSYHLQAVLDDEMVYRKEFLGNQNNYICQFFGDACKSKDSIPLKSGCLLLNNGAALDYYDSRNKCVDRGGDLAIIDGQDDLNKFREVFRRIRKAAKLWIGLRRQWWIWGRGGLSDEVKYSNWLLDNGFKPDRGCMVTELKEYLWKQEDCNSYKRFICQTGPTYAEDPSTPKSATESRMNVVIVLVVGICVPVITIILVVLIVITIVKKRKSRLMQPIIEGAPRDTSYENLQRGLHAQSNFKSNQQYTALQPSSMHPLLSSTDHRKKSPHTELDSDNHYEDIAEIRTPYYLEITP